MIFFLVCFLGLVFVTRRNSLHKCYWVEPKVRLQGYGYNPFCSHRSRCLAVLVWQYFEEAFCAPKVRLKWCGFKGFPSHSSHRSGPLGAFFHSTPGSAQLWFVTFVSKTFQAPSVAPLFGSCWASGFNKVWWHLFHKGKGLSCKKLLPVQPRNPSPPSISGKEKSTRLTFWVWSLDVSVRAIRIALR